MTFAAAYDAGTMEGRGRPRHAAWLGRLPCRVLRLDGTATIAGLVALAHAELPARP